MHNFKPDPAKNEPQPPKVNYEQDPKRINEQIEAHRAWVKKQKAIMAHESKQVQMTKLLQRIVNLGDLQPAGKQQDDFSKIVTLTQAK